MLKRGAMVLSLNVTFYFGKSLSLYMNGNLLAGIGICVLAMICDLIHVSGDFCWGSLCRQNFSALNASSLYTVLVAKCFCLTRLETRTKESNRCAGLEMLNCFEQ